MRYQAKNDNMVCVNLMFNKPMTFVSSTVLKMDKIYSNITVFAEINSFWDIKKNNCHNFIFDKVTYTCKSGAFLFLNVGTAQFLEYVSESIYTKLEFLKFFVFFLVCIL